jgi:serine/threonine protein kinase
MGGPLWSPAGWGKARSLCIIQHCHAERSEASLCSIGHPPFDGDSPVAVAMQHIQSTPKPPSQFNTKIPEVLEEIIMRCLEKTPEMRFKDGSQLARALETLM